MTVIELTYNLSMCFRRSLMIEGFLQTWWPQLTAFVFLIAWLNRESTRMTVRVEQLEKKVEALYVLWNKQIDRMLDKADKK
tara:strand:- start:14566 stop:14808 length:243 start_codon:yes stop_codon:yes gene_type:complete